MIRAIPYCESQVCAATALKTWLSWASITEGPLFRSINRWAQMSDEALSPGSINLILKSIGEQCGWDFIPDLSGHSFRRGVSTPAAREKIDFELIKKQGGWKSDATVWEYIEEGQQFSENSAIQLMEKVSAPIRKTE